MNYAPTLHFPYVDVSGVMGLWSQSCQKMAVFEHSPDEGCATVHLHILMEGSTYTTPEALKRQFHSLVQTDKKGNALWAWSHKDFPIVSGLDSSGGMQYLTYMTKGIHNAKFLKNISPALVDKAKAMWVNKSPVDHLPAESKSEFDIILKQLTQLYHDKDLPSPMQFKNDICYLYLKKRKPVPRMGDLLRYSYSAHMILQMDRAQEKHKETVLTSAISEFLISYESGNIR